MQKGEQRGVQELGAVSKWRAGHVPEPFPSDPYSRASKSPTLAWSKQFNLAYNFQTYFWSPRYFYDSKNINRMLIHLFISSFFSEGYEKSFSSTWFHFYLKINSAGDKSNITITAYATLGFMAPNDIKERMVWRGVQ